MALTDDQIESLADRLCYGELRFFYQTWFKFDDYGRPVFTITLSDENGAVQYKAVVGHDKNLAVANTIADQELSQYLHQTLTADVVYATGQKEMVAFINHDESHDYHAWREDCGRSSFGADFEIGMFF